MPIIEVHLFKGYSAPVRTRLINALTDAFRMVLPAPPASITVMLHELERENYMRGGAMRRRGEALEEPTALMLTYLAAVERGDYALADSYITDDCEYHLPGGVVVDSPAKVIAWATARSKVMGIAITGTETGPGERGPVVHLRGLLSGEWHDGGTFKDVRMCTRYSFDRNQICRVDLWNDLADHALARGGFRVAAPDGDGG
jgi:4-oxalocrotonate tautomerase family enzyme